MQASSREPLNHRVTHASSANKDFRDRMRL
jgi:hypothetical protein